MDDREAHAAGCGDVKGDAASLEAIVREVADDVFGQPPAEGGKPSGSTRPGRTAIDSFKQISEKYKEQPNLLDPYLEHLVAPLIATLKELAHTLSGTENQKISKEQILRETVRVSRFLHVLATVRGFKTVLRFYPSAPEDLEPALYLLLQLNTITPEASAGYDEATVDFVWEGNCTLLLWLSLLVLVPFDLATIDSSMINVESSEPSSDSIVFKLVETCKEYLANSGLVREMAAYLLSQLLTRPDNTQALKDFFEWSQNALAQERTDGSGVFLTVGIASAIAAIFKHGSRLSLLSVVDLGWRVVEILGSLPEYQWNSLIRKLRCKLLCRVGLVNLKPKVAKWRYQMGHRSIEEALHMEGGAEQNQRAPACTNASDDDDDDDIDDIEVVEELIGNLLEALTDKDTIVRWSAAKGIGRLANRLPKDMIVDIIMNITEYFTDTETDGAWHGGCLAIAELAWRGLLLPEQLSTVIPKTIEALAYDVKRGAHSVGSHVRDAACYVFWSFSRSYSSETMADYQQVIASHLLVIACFDREVNCRRAAAAAFQEMVGRQGNIVHGIDALTIADYFTLSSRKAAYLTVSTHLASFNAYKPLLASHLLGEKVFHWEKALRELAAEALALLVGLSDEAFHRDAIRVLLNKCDDKALDVRHGAIAGLGHVLPSVVKSGSGVTEAEMASVRVIMEKVDNPDFYRGKGGTIMREAVCCFLRGVCLAALPMDKTHLERMDRCITENLKHSSALVQEKAVLALECYYATYVSKLSADGQRDCTANKFIRLIQEEMNSTSRQGYCLALGSTPAAVLWVCMDEVFACLKDNALTEKTGDPNEIETKVAAVQGISKMCAVLMQTAGDDAGRRTRLEGLLREGVLPCLMQAMDDYTIDNRGDVGSWVRQVAMEALERSVIAACALSSQEGGNFSPGSVQDTIETRALRVLVKQSFEKIDRIRHAACLHCWRMLKDGRVRERIESWQALDNVFRRFDDVESNTQLDTFGDALAILSLEGYRYSAMQGIVLSAGGLGDLVSQNAVSALVAAAEKGGKGLLVAMSWDLHRILSSNKGNGRVCLATMRTLDILFAKASLADAEDSSLFEALLVEVWATTKNCRDVVLLQVVSSLLSNLTYAGEPVFTAALYKLIALLTNRYPKVRRCVAEHLYMRLISFDDDEDEQDGGEGGGSFDIERATDVVSEVSWDTGAAADIKKARLELFACFNMQPPKKVETVKIAKEADNYSSYQSLVNATGY